MNKNQKNNQKQYSLKTNQVLTEALKEKQQKAELQRKRLERIPDNVALHYKGINQNQSVSKWEMDYDFLMQSKKEEILQRQKKEKEKEEQRKLNGFKVPFLPQFDKSYSIESYLKDKDLFVRYNSLIKILDYTNQYKNLLLKNKQQIQDQIDILNLQNVNISNYKKILLSANTLEEASFQLKEQFHLEDNEIQRIFNLKIDTLFGVKIDNSEALNILKQKLEEYDQLLLSLNDDFNKIKEEFINLNTVLKETIIKNQIFSKLRKEVDKLCSYIKMFYIILNFEGILNDYQSDESKQLYEDNWDYNNTYLIPNINDQILLLEQNFNNEQFIDKIRNLKMKIITIFNNNWDDSFNDKLITEIQSINLEMEQFFKDKFIKSESYLNYIKKYTKTINNDIVTSSFDSITELNHLVQMKNYSDYRYYDDSKTENLFLQRCLSNTAEQIKKLENI